MEQILGLDRGALDRARVSRDPRFDGKFFIAVTSTGIYCRPVCPVRSPKKANVRYYTTAAAAAEAGFRPCLRCRPEAAPGTPAWLGTSAVVRRALRLIQDGALDEGSVDGLAGRVGVGPRHLHRLFVQHVGASPITVAQTRRLHFAKRLLDETDLPITQVALAAGFGSLRRFNDTFQRTYRRAPRELRRRRRGGLAADPARIALAFKPDPLLAPLVKRRPGLRIPGAWDPFECAVRAVLGQQVSVAAARTLAARLDRAVRRPSSARRARRVSGRGPRSTAHGRRGWPAPYAGRARGAGRGVAALAGVRGAAPLVQPKMGTSMKGGPMGNRSVDPIRGKTFRWTFTNGPTAGKTYEHRFNDNGTVVWRDVKEPAKSKSASEKAKPGADEAPVRYAAFRVADDVYTVSYLALSGYTLTVVLNFKDHRMYGFASNDKQWFPVEGTFEVQG